MQISPKPAKCQIRQIGENPHFAETPFRTPVPPRDTKQYIDRGELVRGLLRPPPRGSLLGTKTTPPKKGCFSGCGTCFSSFSRILLKSQKSSKTH